MLDQILLVNFMIYNKTREIKRKRTLPVGYGGCGVGDVVIAVTLGPPNCTVWWPGSGYPCDVVKPWL